MVLYFTGTGNSRYAAQIIARICDDELVSMNDIMRARYKNEADAQREFISEKPFVFVCPTYSWNLPQVVKEFIGDSMFGGSREAYFYITCGHSTGPCTQDAAALCKEINMDFRGLSSVKMPENFITLFDSSSYDDAVGILAAAVSQIESAARLIACGREITDPNAKDAPKSFTNNFVKLFYRRYMNDSKFTVDKKKCISCGSCESICPLANVRISDGYPTWNGRCTQCMGCIGICPTDAISCGKASEKRRRYYLDEYGRQKI